MLSFLCITLKEEKKISIFSNYWTRLLLYSRILHIIQEPNPTISVHSNIPDLKVCLNFNRLFLLLFPVYLQIQNIIGF